MQDSFNAVYFAINSLIFAAAAICVPLAFLRATQQVWQPRLSLRSLLIGVAWLAVLCAILRYEWTSDRIIFALLEAGDADYHPATAYPWWIAIPLLSSVMSIVAMLTMHSLEALRAIYLRRRSANDDQLGEQPSSSHS